MMALGWCPLVFCGRCVPLRVWLPAQFAGSEELGAFEGRATGCLVLTWLLRLAGKWWERNLRCGGGKKGRSKRDDERWNSEVKSQDQAELEQRQARRWREQEPRQAKVWGGVEEEMSASGSWRRRRGHGHGHGSPSRWLTSAGLVTTTTAPCNSPMFKSCLLRGLNSPRVHHQMEILQSLRNCRIQTSENG